jgi:hypothetical protein
MKRYLVKYKDDWNNIRTYGIYGTETEAITTAWEIIEREVSVEILDGREVVGSITNPSWSAVWYSNLNA